VTTLPAPQSKLFDAVLCDLDGVIRFYDATEVAKLERGAGLPEGSTAKVAFSPENDLPLLLGQIDKAQWVESIAHGLALQTSKAQAHALGTAFANARSWADERVVAVLRQVRAHVPVLLVTNATPWLEHDLAVLGLADLADDVISSARVGVAKPDPRIYEIAAARSGVPADRCLFLDDRQENVDAAVALGMTGVLYRGPADLLDALTPVLEQGSPVSHARSRPS
jgi:putative hydrolase of the HAD superfamily